MRFRTMRGRFVALAAATVAATLALSACAPERSVEIPSPPQAEGALPDETQAQLEQAVTNAMVATGSSGAIVGVWVPWSGTWVTGLGTESATDATPVTADMQFRIADATRPMICDVLFAVALEETVSLDDSITEYVAGVPDLDKVTLRQLCDGTAGIGSYQSLLLASWLSNPDRVWDARELASFGLGQPRISDPGAAWRESDAGYVLLGLALERATQKSAATLLDEYVFDPLDLTATSLPPDPAAVPALPVSDEAASAAALAGHHSLPDAEGVLNCTDPLDITKLSATTGFTDSGVVSNINDLGRYARALATDALDPADEAGRWAKPQPIGASAPSWMTYTGGAYQAGSLIGQHGSVPGYITAVYTDPKTGMTVAVVLNNSAAGGAIGSYLAWQLAAIASKAPAASGETAPEFGLPWTAEQYQAAITAAAICTAPPAP